MAAARKKTTSTPETVRLQVLLARCGLGSRRACEDYITTGRVTVDGEPATELGFKVDVAKQKVAVDGELIRPERTVCYMVNKPKGVLCTNSDPAGRPRVVDLFPKSAGRLFPVGRLDENSVGLLLVTNDGDLSHRLAHPRFKVPKVYEVLVAGKPSREIMLQLRQGMYFSDGRFKVDNARVMGTRGKSTILEVTLSEGRNREIRRLFSRVGHKVMKLERVAFGPLKLRGVGVGKYRALTREELKLLDDYIEHGEQRAKKADAASPSKSTKAPPARSSSTAPKKRKGPEARVVEIGPVSTGAGHDLTGRKRNAAKLAKKESRRRFDEDDDDEAIDLSTHPAVVEKKQSASSGSKSPSGKKAVRRPVTVSFSDKNQKDSEAGASGGKGSGSAGTSADGSTRGRKSSRGKSMSRKKQVKAKQAGKRRKRR